jgi:stage V sporulation protein G
MNITVTDIRIKKHDTDNKIKGIVSVTIDDTFVVHDIKIIESENGLFIAMPSKKGSDGKFKDVAHPINTETRNMLQELILEKYKEVQ